MNWLRKVLYEWGFRPKPGSIFFSPSLNLRYRSFDRELSEMDAYFSGLRKGYITLNNLRASEGLFPYPGDFNPYGVIIVDEHGDEIRMNPCKVRGCGIVDEEKAMCFRRTDWCSETHRKILAGEIPCGDASFVGNNEWCCTWHAEKQPIEVVNTLDFKDRDWYLEHDGQVFEYGFDIDNNCHRWFFLGPYYPNRLRGRGIAKPYVKTPKEITGWIQLFPDGGWRTIEGKSGVGTWHAAQGGGSGGTFEN